MSPYHFDKKGKLRPAAFRAEPGRDDASVIRLAHADAADFCKRKALEIANNTPGKTYKGLAVLTAEQIRGVGAEVTDSRDVFCGHAHISYGIIVRRNEPQESELNLRLTEMTRRLLKVALYHEDPNPSSASWTGPPL